MLSQFRKILWINKLVEIDLPIEITEESQEL